MNFSQAKKLLKCYRSQKYSARRFAELPAPGGEGELAVKPTTGLVDGTLLLLCSLSAFVRLFLRLSIYADVSAPCGKCPYLHRPTWLLPECLQTLAFSWGDDVKAVNSLYFLTPRIVFDDMITLFSWCKFRNDWLRSHFNRLR